MLTRTTRTRWVVGAAAVILALPAAAQVRPDAGTLLDVPRQVPLPPPGGAPAFAMPPPAPAAAYDPSVTLVPAAFEVQGNTVVSQAELQRVLAPFVGQRLDMAGLLRAVDAVRQYYREQDFILTEAYLPQQQFAAAGGTVRIQVLEARIGRARVQVEGVGPSPGLAESIVQMHLRPGILVTGYLLEKPVLLLRDLPGFDASAEVQPGANPGEADVVVTVRPAGQRFGGSVGVDNFGSRSAGQIRAYVDAEITGLAGHGDVLGARLQLSDRTDSNLYRVGYSGTLGADATKLGLQLVRTEYALGRQFAALGAVGDARVLSLTATQPFIRSRAYNLFGALALERKDLNDRTATPASSTDRRVDSVRFTVLGNSVDAWSGNSFNTYALSLTHGDLKLDTAALALDQGAGGLRTAGHFHKLNVDLQRTTFISAQDRFTVNLQGQKASRNLTSAEKIALGGPNAVRGYPVGEAVGDSGVIASIEYRRQLAPVGTVPLSASVFYDWGHVKFNESGVPFPTTASQTLGSVGAGLTAGGYGGYLASLQLAWRTTGRAPASDPDRKPRVWLSLQKWL